MHSQPDGPFRYPCISADMRGTVADWTCLRAALQNPMMRGEVACRFTLFSIPGEQHAELHNQLTENAHCVSGLFAGAADVRDGASADGQSGFATVTTFLQKSMLEGEREKTADVLMKIINSSVWELR